jgi:hypothetical protein
MGDLLEEDVFEDEHRINDYNNKDEVDDGDHSQSEEDVEQADVDDEPTTQIKSDKLSKRKLKFDKLKAKKKSRLAESSSVQKTHTTLTKIEQREMLMSNNHRGVSFDIDQFFESCSSKSFKNPFIAAIEASIANFLTEFQDGNLEAGCPRVVVVCAGARRAASVINSMSKEAKCKIGKLFAKHFKVQDQVVALRQPFPIVVGTPNRLSKLIELGALSLESMDVLLIDADLDAKNYSVMTLPGVCEDFYALLSGPVREVGDRLRLSVIREE